MGGLQKPDRKGARRHGRSLAAMKPEQYAHGERVRPFKPVLPTAKGGTRQDDANPQPTASPQPIATLPLERHIVDRRPAKPLHPRRHFSSAFLQPEQFLAELRVSPATVKQLDPGSRESAASKPPSPHLESLLEPRSSYDHGDGGEGMEHVSRVIQVVEGSAPKAGRENGSESLQVSDEGKPEKRAHLRTKTAAPCAPLTSTTLPETAIEQTARDKNSEEAGGLCAAAGVHSPRLLKSWSHGSGGLGNPSLHKMRERLARSFSGRRESDRRSAPSPLVEGHGGGRLRRMLHWGAPMEFRKPAGKHEHQGDGDENSSPRSSASSASTTYSEVSSKSHSYNHRKSQSAKPKLWALRVRPRENHDAAALATGQDPTSTSKHKRNSTWDAGKLSLTSHIFSPKQPLLPTRDTHVLLAPPKPLNQAATPSTTGSASSPGSPKARLSSRRSTSSRAFPGFTSPLPLPSSAQTQGPSEEPDSRPSVEKVDKLKPLPLPTATRLQGFTFEEVVAGRGRAPPTDNTLMQFFFKCREIEHLNRFLALQKRRFLDSSHTECFHMIVSAAGAGLSSMVSTLCTAWLLENTMASVTATKWHPIPVMNMGQREIWQHRDAAWLFHVCGIDASAVLFLDEITPSNETVISGRVKRAVIGQDILITKDEVASSCTIVAEKFRQEAPTLLQARYMMTLLLAGILVDTHNLTAGSSRDKQQATMLLVGAGSPGRNGFYNQLVNIRDEEYVTLFIKEIYGGSTALTGKKPAHGAPAMAMAMASADKVPALLPLVSPPEKSHESPIKRHSQGSRISQTLRLLRHRSTSAQ